MEVPNSRNGQRRFGPVTKQGDECPRLAVRLARSVDPPCASHLEVFTMPTLKAIGGAK